MSYDEEQQRKSRIVVETPTARREVVQTQVSRVPPERSGISTGAAAALVIGAVALVTIIFLFIMNRQDTTNTNVRVATTQPTPMQQPVIVQQPAQQPPPVIVQQPATTTTAPAPIIVTPPASTSTSPTTTSSSSASDDLTIQTAIEKKLADDPTFSPLGITVTVIDGKATLMGSVNSEDLRRRIERFVKIKGVRTVDNQITVTGT